MPPLATIHQPKLQLHEPVPSISLGHDCITTSHVVNHHHLATSDPYFPHTSNLNTLHLRTQAIHAIGPVNTIAIHVSISVHLPVRLPICLCPCLRLRYLARSLRETRRNVQSRISGEEISRSQQQCHRLGRHDWIVFRTGEVGETKSVPQHNIGVGDVGGRVGVNPFG